MTAYAAFGALPVFCVIKIVLLCASFFVTYKCIRFMMEDSKESREGLVTGWIVGMVGTIVMNTMY